MKFDIVIVGAGHGGAQAAIALREGGFEGSLCIVGDEPEAPYERPPLSKGYLSGAQVFDQIRLRPNGYWADKAVTLLAGRSVEAVDAQSRQISCASGEIIGYRQLIWSAGARPRRLDCDGHDLAGVHSLRTRAEVDAIRAELPGAHHIVIVGGGYIGLEAASVLVTSGHSVTVVEAQDRLLARVAGEALADFYRAEHQRRGVEVRLSSMVERLHGEDGRVTAVTLSDGDEIPADLVLAGIGVLPNVEPLLEAGARGLGGVDVDELCRTSLEGVYAIGDCAAHVSAFAGGARIRLESFQNANDMANCAAKAILGAPAPYGATPWFWSDQYGLQLQSAGLSQGHDRVVMRGAPTEAGFCIAYLRQGRLLALDCVNRPRDFVQGRALVTAGALVDAERLADLGIALRDARA